MFLHFEHRLLSCLRAAAALSILAVVSTAACAEGDPAAGKRVFARCALCHTAEPGKNKVGPSLFSVIGRPAASAPGFSYSPAMSEFRRTWDVASLDEYLADPRGVVPGNKMIFPGLRDQRERADLIAFLATLH